MKIAFIVGEFPTLSETFILNQITGLLDLGHDVEIFAHKGNFNIKIHSDVLKYRLEKRTHFLNIPPQKFKRILESISLIVINFYRSPLRILRALNIFKYGKQALSLNLLYAAILFLNKDFDIIYCHFGSIGNFGACLKQTGVRGKLVSVFHGADMRIEIDKGKTLYRSLFNIGDRFLVASDYGYKMLLQFGADPKKIVLHPIGIDVKKFSRQLSSFTKKDSKIRIITVARLVEEKGLEYGIKAIKELVKNSPIVNYEYCIIGEGPLEISLKKLVGKLDLTNFVHFLGPMTQEDIAKELKKAHIFFLPSISESFGVVLLEAQAMSLPIVATRVGGISEAVQDGKSGYLVPSKDIKAMVNKIEYLIKNQKTRLEMGGYGRKFVENNYSISALNHRLNNNFNILIKENPIMNNKNKKIIITTSWDDGHLLDLKLAKLLTKYEIPATFYIPLNSSKQKILSDTKIRELNKSFEVGSHTCNHINLTQINYEQAINEILNGKEGLEKILRHRASMFSYPFGAYNRKIVSIVEKVGFKGSRTTKMLSTNIKNIHEIPTTFHAANHPISYYFKQALSGNIMLFIYLLRKRAFKNWGLFGKESLDYVIKHGGVWHLWGHSWEIEKNKDWDKLEEVFMNIIQIKKEHPEIILTTNSGLIKERDNKFYEYKINN